MRKFCHGIQPTFKNDNIQKAKKKNALNENN